MQFFLGIAGYSSKVPFDPSMMVISANGFSVEDPKRINQLVVQRGSSTKNAELNAASKQQLSADQF